MVYKEALRELSKERLGALSSDALERKSRGLSSNLQELFSSNHLAVSTEDIDCLGVFAPLTLEPVWYLEWSCPGVNLLFPTCGEEGSMAFAFSTFEQLERKQMFGTSLRVPPVEAERTEPPIVLIPGLAFSLSGGRIGRGMGYYDKYLQNFAGVKIGVCFKEQVLDAFETQDHDVAMDYVVTDEGTLFCHSHSGQERI